MPDLSRPAVRPKDRDPNRALEALFFAFKAVTAGPDEVLLARGLSRVHHRILFFIAKSPDLRVNELRGTLGVTKQAMNAPLRELTERGLVAESVDEADRVSPPKARTSRSVSPVSSATPSHASSARSVKRRKRRGSR